MKLITLTLLTCYLFVCFATKDNAYYEAEDDDDDDDKTENKEDYATKAKKLIDHGELLCRAADLDENRCRELKNELLCQLQSDREEDDEQDYLIPGMPVTEIRLPHNEEL